MPLWSSGCMYQDSMNQSFPSRTPPSRMACGNHTAGTLCHKFTHLCCGCISFPPINSQLWIFKYYYGPNVQRQQRQPLVANKKAAMQVNPWRLRNRWCRKALWISTLISKWKSTVAHWFSSDSHLGNANWSPHACVPFSSHSGVPVVSCSTSPPGSCNKGTLLSLCLGHNHAPSAYRKVLNFKSWPMHENTKELFAHFVWMN